MTVTKEEIMAMSSQEKQQLLEMIWESFEETNDQASYTDNLPEESEEELHILKERMDEYKKEPSSAKTWDEAFRELKKKYE